MLQIRLNKGSAADGSAGPKSFPVETVTVACPDHLVLADLPVAKGLGSATAASRVKIVGRRSRRQLGDRVHFCVRCDFPIAIYGRLSPCEHAFCLDCARSDSICYLCNERIQKIQTIKMMEGIFICAAPHCLKTFLKKTEFESHILESHADILQSYTKKEETKESDSFSIKQPSPSDPSVRGPPRPSFPPSSNDREDRARRQQPPLKPLMQPKLPPYYVPAQNLPSELQAENRPPGFEGSNHANRVHQQSFDTHGGTQQDFGQFSDKQQSQQQPGILSEQPQHEYPPPYFQPPPNFPMPGNPNQVLPTPPFGFPPFAADGAPPFYGAPMSFEVPRSDAAGMGTDQGSLLGFPPFMSNFPDNFPRPWSGGPAANAPFEVMQADGSGNPSDPQGRSPFYQGDYGKSSSSLPLILLHPPMSSKAMQAMSSMDGKGILAAQPMMPPPPPPPGPPPAHLLQQKHGNYASGDSSRDGMNYGWQHEQRDSFGCSQD